MSAPRFDLPGLHAALEAERCGHALSRAALGHHIGVAASTVARTAGGAVMEADGVLAMVRWLGVAPETFVVPPAPHRAAPLSAAPSVMVRADTTAMHAAVDRRRVERGLTWPAVADQVGVPVVELRRLGRGGRTTIATLTSVAAWLDVPIAELTRASDR